MNPHCTESLSFDEDEDRAQRLCAAITMLHFSFSIGLSEPQRFTKKMRDSIGGDKPVDFDRNTLFCLVLPRIKKIKLDLSLQIFFPKRDDGNMLFSWTVFDVHPDLNDFEIYDQVKRKVNTLYFFVKGGPNSFDRFLFFLRKVTATPQQRPKLFNGQPTDFLTNYIIPYGPGWGRFYYVTRTGKDFKTYVKSSAIVGGLIFLIRKMKSVFF